MSLWELESGVVPSPEWTTTFGQWLGTTRKTQCRASRWADGGGTARAGRGADSVVVMLKYARHHVWPELWPAMRGFDSRAYWARVDKLTGSLTSGGAQAKELARRVGVAAAAAAAARGVEEAAQRAAGLAAQRQATEQIRAASVPVSTRHHLFQTGEYV